MKQFKKFIVLSLVIVFVLILVSCDGGDKEPPVITLEKDTITHAIDVDVDLLDGVSATDNETDTKDIVIEISDYNGYDKNKAGTYEITVKATDKEGNSATKKITVIVKVDVVAPSYSGNILPIEHIEGETVDLTEGIVPLDNIDESEDVTITVSDYGSYNKDVPGTYTIKFTLTDTSGNESAPINRTVIVHQTYSRVEMTTFEGEVIRYKALYNPQVLNGNTSTGYNTAYNGDYVNVLSKDYVEWLLEYAPERIGAGVGWSIIAVTDADDKIVYMRHWNSGYAYHDEDGELVSESAVDWSTGTNRTWTETVGGKLISKSNAKFSSGEMGLMMANINEWIPDDGHVVIFLNWVNVSVDDEGKLVTHQNETDMARAFGAVHIMNSDEDGDDVKDYAIGRELRIVSPEKSLASVRKSYDAENPFPIITVPGKFEIDKNGVWRNKYIDVVYLDKYSTENPYNPLLGVTANNGKGTDITSNITYKVYNYTTTEIKYDLPFVISTPIIDPIWEELVDDPYTLEGNEVSLANVLLPANHEKHYVIEYTVTANGHTDKAYRLIQVQAELPDYVELYGSSDTVFTEVAGQQQRLDLDPNYIEFGPFDQTEKGIIYDGVSFKALVDLPELSKAVVVVLDRFQEVKLVRVLNGVAFELDTAGKAKTTGLSWTASDAFAGLADLVEDKGYVVIYPEGKNAEVINKALKAYYDIDYDGAAITTVKAVNGAIAFKFVYKEVTEVTTLIENGEAPVIDVNSVDVNIGVVENSENALVFNPGGGGAGFRLDVGKAYYFTKEVYTQLLLSDNVVNSFTTLSVNHGLPWMNNGVIVVFDADGNFVHARIALAGSAAEIYADGRVVVGNKNASVTTEAAINGEEDPSNLSWDVISPNAVNTQAHGPFLNLVTEIPDGGSIYIFPNTTSSSVRNYAIHLLWNPAYSGGLIAEATADNADTNAFASEIITVAYLQALEFERELVATVSEKPARLVRPKLALELNTLSWDAVEGAASYDLYVDGVLEVADVGEVVEDKLVFEMAALDKPSGIYQLAVRAIPENPAANAVSVLSDAVEYEMIKLEMPENFVLTDDVLSWDAVDNAVKYLVSIDDGEAFLVETNSLTIPADKLVNDTKISIIAIGGETAFDSPEAIHILVVTEYAMAIGATNMAFKEFNLAGWLAYAAGDIGAQNIAGLVVVTDLAALAETDDAVKLFNGGYLALVGSDNKVKYIATRWGQSWDPVNGWVLNGADQTARWDWGNNILASYVKPHLAEGDYLILASQYSKGLSLGNYRNLFGNELIIDLGIPNPTTDHRQVLDFAEAIDPSTVTIAYKEVVRTDGVLLGETEMARKDFTLAGWLAYAAGDIGAQNIAGLVVVTDLAALAETDDAVKLFNGGYLALVGSDNKVKYIATRWGQSWDPVNGWVLNGADQTARWDWGNNILASYVKPHLAEGDYLILASQYSKGLSLGNYRNLFGNELIIDLGIPNPTTDHRQVLDFAEAIDPSTVTVALKELVKYLDIVEE